MLKYLVAFVFVIAALVGGLYVLNILVSDNESGAKDYKAVMVTIDGKPVAIGTEGTQYFGSDAKGDLNDDGTPDLAFIVRQSGGGSGIFFYAVAALQHADGTYTGTNAILLGDRIAPQTTEIRNGILIVNYADRRPDEPFTTQPSVGVTAYLYYIDGELKAEWPVSLFYYNPNLDKDARGNILCSEKGLVALSRLMPGATVEMVVNALLEGRLSDEQRAAGLTTEFPLEGFSLSGSRLENNVLTLTFNDPLNKTSGGACRVGILWAQIEKTAKEFTGASEVRFEPEELFQP